MSVAVIPPDEKDPSRLAFVIRQLCEGRSNATGSVTVISNVASTVVSAVNCAAGSAVFLFPASSTAASTMAVTYVTNVIKNQFTLNHASDANTNKTWYWVALG